MARRKPRNRIYWRSQGRARRAYGDFRDYSDVGGGREALIAPGEARATTDPDVAQKLVADRVKELESRRRNKTLLGLERPARLGEFAQHHLTEKAKSGNVSEAWLAQSQYQLQAALEFLGDRDLTSIRVYDVQRFANHLRQLGNGRGGKLSSATIRLYLNSLSNLYTRAASEGCVPPGYNPVSAIMDKPVARRREARWLEIHEAALLLESARIYRPQADAFPFMYPLLATFLLTGGRKAEVLGLEVEDVSFDRRTVTFRPNKWRGLKTSTSHRSVPLWPQVEEILREYVFGGEAPLGSLLFPSARGREDLMITDLRKSLDAIAAKAGWKAGEIRTKIFRHTYCATRLQTLDRGAPVSEYTVAKELGHGGRAMVERVYGHLGQVRHRAEVVEYRVEQHRDVLGERLTALQASGATR
ncbi:hypothetical protein AMJ82_05670 [candidate division TA06 bacterium SM23_40]|uniref:Tyr recombinase domain-containing protein n=1 Tax=candidate division TA06 bacterium SM23_40 TaxID=1703774 RepID=A0A0S8GAT2_UNCT6|nr:MAG: hypothetical protein AMJ82_05670 [candidate division TA06 bacterium SM23_40]